MITSYSTLQASIADFLHRSDLTTVIPEFIAAGESRIYDEMRVAQMETAFSSAISSGTVTLPTGYLEWKYLYVDGSFAEKLQRKDAEWIYTNYPNRTGQGKPLTFAREADTLIFGPYPDSGYTIKGVYYKRLTGLSDANTTNWLITDAPELIKYAAIIEACGYLRDDSRIQLVETKYEQAKQRLLRSDKRELASGSKLVVTAG